MTRTCSLVERFEITKGTIIFEINFVKLFDKYPKMMTSSVTKILKKFARKIKKILNKLELFNRSF